MTQPESRKAAGHKWRAPLGYAAGLAAGATAWQLLGAHSASYVFVSLSATIARLGQMISGGGLPIVDQSVYADATKQVGGS